MNITNTISINIKIWSLDISINDKYIALGTENGGVFVYKKYNNF